MAILHFRSIERRRTARAALCMDVLAYGDMENGEKFKYWTKTVSVSQYGGVILVEAPLNVGQLFQLMNEFNMKKAEARVVSLRKLKDGQAQAAFEFVKDGDRFWSMVFPPAGAKPLRKPVVRQANG